MTIASLTSSLSTKLLQHSPAILTGIGVVGVISTALLTARAAVEAHEIIKEEEEDSGETLRFRDKLDLTWRIFLPPVLMATTTIVCVVCAQSINTRRNAALMSLYTITDRTLTEFREKTREIHGETKVSKINDEIATDRVAAYPADEFWHRQVEVRGDGVGLCKDMYSDRYFVSSRNEVDAAVNVVNSEINTEGYADLNMFYDQIGVGSTEFGSQVGWVLGGLLEVQYTYIPSEDGSPCMAVTFKRQPEHNFHRIWR